jgi:hypothetical protein
MTRFASLLLILLLILGGVWWLYPRKHLESATLANTNQNWHDFTAPQGKFRARLPSLPHHATETVEDPKTHEKRLYDFFISSKDDGTIYAINTINFPEKKQPTDYNDDFLRTFILQMLMNNPQNKIKTLEVKPFRSANALDFKIENAEGTVDGKAFFDDNTLYILSTTARQDRYNGQEFSLFIDSFQLPLKAK